MEDRFKKLINEVNKSNVNHQKYQQMLQGYYEEMPFEEFMKQLTLTMHAKFHNPIRAINAIFHYLNFITSFITTIATKHEYTMKQQNEDSLEDMESHPLLKRIIDEILKFSTLKADEPRFNSCKLIEMILGSLGTNIELDDDICDNIQQILLPRLTDCNRHIRAQGIRSLARLQDPHVDCPIIKGFCESISDLHFSVRKEAVQHIAFIHATREILIMHIRDTDHLVRATAYRRFADMGPKVLKITERQQILEQGFFDDHPVPKSIFVDILIPKWLSGFDSDILKFLLGIKFDANEADFERTYVLAKKILKLHFESHSIKDLIGDLNLNEAKLVDVNNLNFQYTTYWYLLLTHLKTNVDFEEFVDELIPDLSVFCDYITSFIQPNESKPMNSWEKLEYNEVVRNLFKIVGEFDLADEVGREKLLELIKHSLINHTFHHKTTLQIINVLYAILGDLNATCEKVESVIQAIREKTVERPVQKNADKQQEERYQNALIKVKLMTLQDELESAITAREFNKAAELEAEVKETRMKLRSSQEMEIEQVVMVSSQPEVINHCLDVLNAILSLRPLKELFPSLENLKAELIDTVFEQNEDLLNNEKIFKAVTLFSILDKEIAQEHIKFLITPVLLYKLTTKYNNSVLISAINGCSDLIGIYGSEIFPSDDVNDNSTKKRNGRRFLARASSAEIEKFLVYNYAQFLETIYDILDDENEEVKDAAGNVITSLLHKKAINSPLFVTKLLVRWFNPNTVKCNPKFLSNLSKVLLHFAKETNNGEDIFEETVIPTLDIIANAPKNSPLVDIDVDKMMKILSDFTSISNRGMYYNSHKNLAYALCSKLAKETQEKNAHFYAKMLNVLNLSTLELNTLEELGNNVTKLLQTKNKWVGRNLMKFQNQLNSLILSLTQSEKRTAVDPISEMTEISLKITNTAKKPKKVGANKNTSKLKKAGVNAENTGNTSDKSVSNSKMASSSGEDSENTFNSSVKKQKVGELGRSMPRRVKNKQISSTETSSSSESSKKLKMDIKSKKQQKEKPRKEDKVPIPEESVVPNIEGGRSGKRKRKKGRKRK